MLKKICELAQIAGSAIINYYLFKKSVHISYKSNNTLITNVDCESNHIFKKGLFSICSKISILSEEELHDFKDCKNWHNYWLIDSLDGTKEFLKNNGDFTVNFRLIKKGIPVLGVIYAPFFNIFYYFFNKEAWKENKKEEYKKKYLLHHQKNYYIAAGSKVKTWNGGELNYSFSSYHNTSSSINPGFFSL